MEFFKRFFKCIAVPIMCAQYNDSILNIIF